MWCLLQEHNLLLFVSLLCVCVRYVTVCLCPVVCAEREMKSCNYGTKNDDSSEKTLDSYTYVLSSTTLVKYKNLYTYVYLDMRKYFLFVRM